MQKQNHIQELSLSMMSFYQNLNENIFQQVDLNKVKPSPIDEEESFEETLEDGQDLWTDEDDDGEFEDDFGEEDDSEEEDDSDWDGEEEDDWEDEDDEDLEDDDEFDEDEEYLEDDDETEGDTDGDDVAEDEEP